MDPQTEFDNRHYGPPKSFEIDLGAIAHNTQEVRRIVGKSTWLCAALKANAYGFGLGPVAKTVLAAGADALSMVDMAAAVDLRKAGVAAPILLYAGALPSIAVIRAIQDYDLIPTILDRSSAEAYSKLATRPIRAFLKIDVGLERLGTYAEEACDVARVIRTFPNIQLIGVYTHLHVPTGARSARYIDWQFDRFEALIRRMREDSLSPQFTMAASSAVLRFTSGMTLNAVDPGHVLYGLAPPGPDLVRLSLRPAFLALKSRLLQVRDIHRSRFSDRMNFSVEAVKRLGIIPMGRADGLAALNCGEALVRDHRVSILGPITLEHTSIDLTPVPEAAVGDEVVIIGRQDSAEITLEEILRHQRQNTSAALALEVRDTVARVYKRN